MNESEVTAGTVAGNSRAASEKKTVFRQKTVPEEKTTWGKHTHTERTPSLPSPVQNDEGTKSSETPASAALAVHTALLAVTIARDTVLENQEEKHSPETQTPKAAASLLTASAPVRNSSE